MPWKIQPLKDTKKEYYYTLLNTEDDFAVQLSKEEIRKFKNKSMRTFKTYIVSQLPLKKQQLFQHVFVIDGRTEAAQLKEIKKQLQKI